MKHQMITHCKCGAAYRVKGDLAGKKARCKKCGTIFRMHAISDQTPPRDAPSENENKNHPTKILRKSLLNAFLMPACGVAALAAAYIVFQLATGTASPPSTADGAPPKVRTETASNTESLSCGVGDPVENFFFKYGGDAMSQLIEARYYDDPMLGWTPNNTNGEEVGYKGLVAGGLGAYIKGRFEGFGTGDLEEHKFLPPNAKCLSLTYYWFEADQKKPMPQEMVTRCLQVNANGNDWQALGAKETLKLALRWHGDGATVYFDPDESQNLSLIKQASRLRAWRRSDGKAYALLWAEVYGVALPASPAKTLEVRLGETVTKRLKSYYELKESERIKPEKQRL